MSVQTTSSISQTCREKLLAAVAAIGKCTEAKGRVLILSGGVDTCAILAAASEVGVTFEAGFTVVTGDDSPDKNFASAAATEKGLVHHIIHITSEDLLITYLPACVQLLNTFDGDAARVRSIKSDVVLRTHIITMETSYQQHQEDAHTSREILLRKYFYGTTSRELLRCAPTTPLCSHTRNVTLNL
jgi:hypothetical protein